MGLALDRHSLLTRMIAWTVHGTDIKFPSRGRDCTLRRVRVTERARVTRPPLVTESTDFTTPLKWLAFAVADAMDEVLEVVDLVADSGLEGVVTWLLRLVGLFALLGGLGLWLVGGMELLVLPAALMVVGVVLLVAPSILLALAELA